MSGRRGSNPRPIAWKAIALPTELLPQILMYNFRFLMYAFALLQQIVIRTYQNCTLKCCGEERIRTFEDISQQIYSLSQLAALVLPPINLERLKNHLNGAFLKIGVQN
jgi:hypothetical protein